MKGLMEWRRKASCCGLQGESASLPAAARGDSRDEDGRRVATQDVPERRVVHPRHRTSSARAAQVIKAAQTLSAVQGDWEVNHLAVWKEKENLGVNIIFSPEQHPVS